MNTRFLSILVLSAFLAASLMTGCAPRSVSPASSTASDADQAFDVTVTTLTTAFVPNPGLGETSILFRTLGAGGMVYFGLQELLFPLPSSSQKSPLARAFARPDEKPPSTSGGTAPPAMLRMRFEAASSTVQVIGEKQLSGIVNYFIGNDPARWHAAIPTYGEVAYRGLYPGIDLVYGADKGALKGSYIVAPGADPGLIRWRYEGASEVQLRDGELHIHIAEADSPPLLIEHRPVAWQTIAGQQKPVAVSYEQRRDGTFGFSVGRYDPSQPLIIDPTLDYGTYWGNLGCEGAYHVTTDAANNVYVVGATNVAAFPAQTTDCQAEDYWTRRSPAPINASTSPIWAGTSSIWQTLFMWTRRAMSMSAATPGPITSRRQPTPTKAPLAGEWPMHWRCASMPWARLPMPATLAGRTLRKRST